MIRKFLNYFILLNASLPVAYSGLTDEYYLQMLQDALQEDQDFEDIYSQRIISSHVKDTRLYSGTQENQCDEKLISKEKDGDNKLETRAMINSNGGVKANPDEEEDYIGNETDKNTCMKIYRKRDLNADSSQSQKKFTQNFDIGISCGNMNYNVRGEISSSNDNENSENATEICRSDDIEKNGSDYTWDRNFDDTEKSNSDDTRKSMSDDTDEKISDGGSEVFNEKFYKSDLKFYNIPINLVARIIHSVRNSCTIL